MGIPFERGLLGPFGAAGFTRPRVESKFLYLGEEKFFVRGVTYGAFPPNRDGDQFPEAAQVGRDFSLMREAGTHKSRTEKLADRFAGIFLPIVAFLGLLT